MVNRHSLITRLALLLVLSTFIFSIVYAKLYFLHIVNDELQRSNKMVVQITQTVSSTASIAAYLEDKDLAIEVINGLVSNDVILGASLNVGDQTLAKSILFNEPSPIIITLPNPFILNESIGNIKITPNTVFIEQNARAIAFSSVQTLLIVILPIIFIFAFLAYLMITKPLSKLSEDLGNIIPGSNQRLSIEAKHSHSEIDHMTQDINALLDKAQHLLEQERHLRSEVEVLEKRFRMMFERSSSPTLLINDKGEILLINDAADALLTGMDIDLHERFPDCLGRYCKTPDILYTFTENSMQSKQITQSEFEFMNPYMNATVWLSLIMLNSVSEGQSYFQVFLSDITLKKTMLMQLNKRAQIDSLTGLFNRYGAEITLKSWIDQKSRFSLLLIDLDNFKPINDIYGHNAGDALLIHIADQLKAQVRQNDLICRWGGDEFVVGLLDIPRRELSRVAKSIVASLCEPTSYIKNQQSVLLQVSASVGISEFPDHGETLNILIECADIAMYSVKKTSKNNFSFYSAES